MGIHETAHGLQTTKNPNPKRFFPDLGIHDPKGSSHKEHLDKNHPRPRDAATLRPCDIATLRPCDTATPHPRDHATLQHRIPVTTRRRRSRPLQAPQKTGLLKIRKPAS